MKIETRNEYIERTVFMNWEPYGEVFLPHSQVAQKIKADGSFLPFWGDTMLFYLSPDAVQTLSAVQQKLHESGIPLSNRLKSNQFHMTLHDLDHTMGCDKRWDATKQQVERILESLEDGTVQLTPVAAFPMMNTSIVIGFRPETENDCRLLMEWCNGFEPLFAYGQPTFHVTLAYFRPGDAGQMEMTALKSALDAVNQMPLPILKLSKHDLVYQRFYDMNCYFA